MEKTTIENKIITFLEDNKGTRYTIKDVAKAIDEVDNYTWIIRKCKMLNQKDIIQITEEIITSSQGNRLLSKQVWIK